MKDITSLSQSGEAMSPDAMASMMSPHSMPPSPFSPAAPYPDPPSTSQLHVPPQAYSRQLSPSRAPHPTYGLLRPMDMSPNKLPTPSPGLLSPNPGLVSPSPIHPLAYQWQGNGPRSESWTGAPPPPRSEHYHPFSHPDGRARAAYYEDRFRPQGGKGLKRIEDPKYRHIYDRDVSQSRRDDVYNHSHRDVYRANPENIHDPKDKPADYHKFNTRHPDEVHFVQRFGRPGISFPEGREEFNFRQRDEDRYRNRHPSDRPLRVETEYRPTDVDNLHRDHLDSREPSQEFRHAHEDEERWQREERSSLDRDAIYRHESDTYRRQNEDTLQAERMGMERERERSRERSGGGYLEEREQGGRRSWGRPNGPVEISPPGKSTSRSYASSEAANPSSTFELPDQPELVEIKQEPFSPLPSDFSVEDRPAKRSASPTSHTQGGPSMKKEKPDGDPINLPPCRICLERASGFHYGLNTCEACKVSAHSLLFFIF